jgi:hypothetical protein
LSVRASCLIVLILLTAAAVFAVSPRALSRSLPVLAGTQQATSAGADVAAGEAAARARCAACHKLPPTDVLPKTLWRDAIARMLLIQNQQPEPSGPPGTAARLVRLPADWESIVKYYEANAPEIPAPLASWPPPDQRLQFQKREVPAPPGLASPSVSNIRLVDIDHDRLTEIVIAEMRSGSIYRANPREARSTVVEIARLANPAHIAPVDLDGDGVLDFLAADLGQFVPSDHDRGAVVWLRGRKGGGYSPTTIDRGPRMADVEAADFDGDGRLDLAVAAFGWRRTGHVTILKNQTADSSVPSFRPQVIDKRVGAIHAVPGDLNGDRRPDVIALFAQEHETVAAYINEGGMRFEPRVVYDAPHPSWGSTGIDVLDFDKDGDLDVLMTNGDAFDDKILKPYHGIRWLENRGVFPFTEHLLAAMPAVHRAQAADLDGDGDLDIAACALVSSEDVTSRSLPALVWLEQTQPGTFERHTLQVGLPTHATLDLGDVDNDGDVDIVVGNFSIETPTRALVEIFENLRVRR